jgi:hypothetical protein
MIAKFTALHQAHIMLPFEHYSRSIARKPSFRCSNRLKALHTCAHKIECTTICKLFWQNFCRTVYLLFSYEFATLQWTCTGEDFGQQTICDFCMYVPHISALPFNRVKISSLLMHHEEWLTGNFHYSSESLAYAGDCHYFWQHKCKLKQISNRIARPPWCDWTNLAH